MENKKLTEIIRQFITLDGIEPGFKHWYRLENRYYGAHIREFIESLDKGKVEEYDNKKINVFVRYIRAYRSKNNKK